MHLDFAKRALNCRILYCGPESSGKTSSLEAIRRAAPAKRRRGETTVASGLEPSLGSEYLKLLLGKTGELSVHLHLYTLPARSSFDLAPMTLLRLLDGMILVLDARSDRVAANLTYIGQLRELLAARDLVLEEVPLVFQWGMLDLPGASTLEELNALYNPLHLPAFAASPPTSRNIVAPLNTVTRLVLATLAPLPGLDLMARIQQPARSRPGANHDRQDRIPREPSRDSDFNGSGVDWSRAADRQGESPSRAREPRKRFDVLGCKTPSRFAWLGFGRRHVPVAKWLPIGEQRREQRIGTRRLVVVSDAAMTGDSVVATCIGRTLNLSQSGMLVELFTGDLPEGSILDVQLALEDHIVDLHARPIRIEGGLVALEFCELSVEGYLIIRETIARTVLQSVRRPRSEVGRP